MHREIEHYIRQHNFDSQTRYGIINEGQRLIASLKRHNNDESQFLRDIDTYEFRASNGRVYFYQPITHTYLNVGKFSFYYHSNCYESTIFDSKGNPTGGSRWIVEDRLNEPYIRLGIGEARGEINMYSDLPEDRKKSILENAERVILQKCRDRFGRW